MVFNTNKVVLDADFFRNITQYECGNGLICKLLSEANYFPVMHRYVADVELRNNNHLKDLIKQNKIQIVSDKEYISFPDIDYDDYFHMAYKKINGFELGDVDISEYGYDGMRPDESLGEIRSVYLAYKYNYSIFLSDDHGSVMITDIVNTKKYKLNVKHLEDVLVEGYNSGWNLTWKDIRVTVPAVYKNRKDKCDKLCKLYQS